MLEIHAQWDDEARVWYATSDDVPGLVTEAPSIEALVERLRAIIPELMELNRGIVGQSFEFHVTSERTAIAEAA
jgi:predicted RNase H-like HicB family nuclease